MDKVAFDAFIGVSTAKVRTIYDQSGNGNDATANVADPGRRISVSFRLVSGRYIPEFDFTGNNDYVITPLTSALGLVSNNHFILSNWRNMDLVARENTVVGSFTGSEHSHQMTIEANGTGTIGQNTTLYPFTIGGTPFDGEYHTIGMSKNGTDAYMRFDRVNTSTTGGVVSETNNIQLRWGSRV